MDEFVVWGVPGSPYVRAALLGLEEKGAPWRLARLGPGDSKSPAHLARHPFGRMPVVDHGDFRLYEVQAILRYLDRIIPEPSLTPAEPKAEARMNQLAGIADWYFLPQVSSAIAFQRVVAPRFGLPVDEAKIAAGLPGARRCAWARLPDFWAISLSWPEIGSASPTSSSPLRSAFSPNSTRAEIFSPPTPT